jgi:hypothetical protein
VRTEGHSESERFSRPAVRKAAQHRAQHWRTVPLRNYGAAMCFEFNHIALVQFLAFGARLDGGTRAIALSSESTYTPVTLGWRASLGTIAQIAPKLRQSGRRTLKLLFCLSV